MEWKRKGDEQPVRMLPREAAICVRRAKRTSVEAESARRLTRGGADGSSLVRVDDGDPATKVHAAM
jgi:hypothetical protein